MTRHFTDEEKAEAVKKFVELRDAGTKIRDIEKEIGIGNATIYGWIGAANKRAKPGRRRAAPPTDATHRLEDGRYPEEIKSKALQMIANGMRQHEVARKLKVGTASISYWVKRERSEKGGELIPAAKVDKGNAAAMKDALIYLTHAERKIMDMVRDGKISRPDPAHLLTLLALEAIQKATSK